MLKRRSLVVCTAFVAASLCCIVSEALWYEDVLQLANESRVLEYPARRYCEGTASISDDLLYETPICTSTTTQTPLINASIMEFELFTLKNLSFCCKSNYTAAMPIGTNITAKDEEARFLYDQAVEGALLRYDCASFYPFRTCAPCAYAYRSWVCAMVFPLACRVSNAADASLSPFQAMPICRDVCLEVVRKCPSVFQSRCPTGTTQYRTPSTPDVFSNASSFGAGGCNPMEHPHLLATGSLTTSGAQHPSAWLTWIGFCLLSAWTARWA
jgi:hypothetical protein